jgi:hypothetical protein
MLDVWQVKRGSIGGSRDYLAHRLDFLFRSPRVDRSNAISQLRKRSPALSFPASWRSCVSCVGGVGVLNERNEISRKAAAFFRCQAARRR